MIYWTLFVITTSVPEPQYYNKSSLKDPHYTMISKHNDRWGCEVAYIEFIDIYQGDGIVKCEKTDQQEIKSLKTGFQTKNIIFQISNIQ